MDDLLNEFLTETSEALAVLDVELVKFEQDPTDEAILGNIFRLVHTIKGTCGFLGLPRLESVAHAGENVLGKFRDGVVEVSPEAVSLILKCLDCIRALLSKLEESGEEPAGEDQALIDELNAMADGNTAPVAAPTPAAEAAPSGDLVLPTDEEIQLVQATFKKAESNTAGIAEMFYTRLFEIEPGLKTLFKGDMQTQGEHLMAMLKNAVEGLNDIDAIVPAVEDLGRRHVDYGVKDKDYDSVGEALLWTLEKGFGEDFTAEVKAAWTTVYTLLANVMINAASASSDAASHDAAPPTNDFGAPVAQDLLDEVMAAQAKGVTAATPAEMDAEMEAERAKEASAAKPEAKAGVPAKAATTAPVTKKEDAKPAKESSVAASSIRVNVDVLEDLMTLVSELVLTRNQLLQMVRGRDQDDEFTTPLQRLSHITSDLQEGVMKTRMQPIGNAWAKLPRIVRDLSLEQDKQIDLIMVGAETELDRQVLELIKDPLTHMVRNSADHGLETPADRKAAGKPEKGIIELRAFHEGGHIIIEIEDDGRGLNMDRIRVKCLENGLATDAELENMSDQQIQQFIFNAGFSTAEKVTSISGRGVGMDVVRTNIEKIGGTVELKSVTGKGSTFTIKIPLTLAIVSALIVECFKQRFAIPQISVLELVRASTKSENAIEMINETPVLRLRNRLLPLVSLENLLEFDKGAGKADEARLLEKKEKERAAAEQAAVKRVAAIKTKVEKTAKEKAALEKAAADMAAKGTA
ncbi:MAG: chemotaxis protein CheA, partial [Proteobacteria bacterium]|nr:chemotaxis protein CheA [Pseudomonadota bacterium]